MQFCDIKLLVFLLVTNQVSSDSDTEKEKHKERAFSLARQWAPKVWLHPEERFFPGDVKEFLKEVTPIKKDCLECDPTSEIPVGAESEGYYLTTNREIGDLLANSSSILYGKNPDESYPPLYSFITPCDSTYKSLIITYWFFYPYNEGKVVCTVPLGKARALPVPKVFKKCLGKRTAFGSHVGDWEHMSLQIKDSVPDSLYLSVHTVGAYYTYDKVSGCFVLSSIKRRGISQVQDPPSTVQIDDGHPIVFVANGSHALWGSVGTYQYSKLNLNLLKDVVDYGTAWNTWERLEVYSTEEQIPDWYNYRGRWGNPRSGCLALSRLGLRNVCVHTDGPDGLSTRRMAISCT
ncbi:putative vacuolar protein sorting-associated protein TDA6 [Homalodisca vitripennis]|uniref:putative vacuolar protein sorting-associated protein TDA6 n=1 Tax=Homalodisca vitripennis TaxID=197043 RepID=UPI001EE9E986|nr:putative vacuolar protein sorting-associated protein TDA6 [Homalodisca vitripennis]